MPVTSAQRMGIGRAAECCRKGGRFGRAREHGDDQGDAGARHLAEGTLQIVLSKGQVCSFFFAL